MSPRPRFQSLPPERREGILTAAAAEFAERGFEAASYNRIIQCAGVSKGAMYYYFDDKRDLYVTTLANAEARARDAIGPLAAFHDPPSFWDALAGLYDRIMAFVVAEPLIAGLVKSAYSGGMAASAAYDEFVERAAKSVEEILAEGIRVGAVRDDVPLDWLVAATLATGEAVDRWTLLRFESLAPAELSSIPARLLELHMRIAAPLPIVIEREAEAARSPSG